MQNSRYVVYLVFFEIVFYSVLLIRHNLDGFYLPGPSITSGMDLRRPIWDPARLLINLTNWAFLFLVPVLYWRIFVFRNTPVSGFIIPEMNIIFESTDMLKELTKLRKSEGGKQMCSLQRSIFWPG